MMIDTEPRELTDTDAWAVLVAEIAELRSQMLDLREWLAAVADDLLDRTSA